MDLTKQELTEIYDYAVNELECAYKTGNLEDVDVAKEPPDKFDIEDPERVLRIQSIILKTDEAIHDVCIARGKGEEGAQVTTWKYCEKCADMTLHSFKGNGVGKCSKCGKSLPQEELRT